MASTIVHPGIAPANPSRRGIIAGLALAPAIALPAVGAAPTLDRVAWDRGMAAFRAADRNWRRFNANVYDPISRQLERVAPRPDLHIDVTGKSGKVTRYSLWPDQFDEFDHHPVPTLRIAARKIEKVWLEHRAAAARLGLDAAGTESDRLCTLRGEREYELLSMAAPGGSALLWKIEALFGEGSCREAGECPDTPPGKLVDVVVADARRLLTT